jgi:hypothetical protein
VAALLSTDERRQFLGNDKVKFVFFLFFFFFLRMVICCLQVVLYICDEGALKPLVPRFRGEVNSVSVLYCGE